MTWPGLLPNESVTPGDEGFVFARKIAAKRYLRTEFVGPDHLHATEEQRAERVREWHAILGDLDAKVGAE